MEIHSRTTAWRHPAAGLLTLLILMAVTFVGTALGGGDSLTAISDANHSEQPEQKPHTDGTVPGSLWQWDHQVGTSLGLRGPQGVVLRLHFDKLLPQPYLHPLGTARGQSLTWLSPPDHAWHFGMWFSWKNINRVNYWEFDGKTGKPAGTTAIRDVEVTHSDQETATVVMQLAYHPAGEASAVVMDETVTLQIETPDEDGSYRIDWRQQSKARVDVDLDRTPPPGQPGGKSWGGYTGLSFRGAKELADVVFTDSHGRTDLSVQRETANWLDTSGTLEGKPVGVTFFDHPTNPRHPTIWYIVKSQLPHGPFTYMNPALLCHEPLKLNQGQTLQLSYRVLVHPGSADAQALEAEFKRFAAIKSPGPAGLSNPGNKSHER